MFFDNRTSLSCKIRAFPPPRVRWFKQDTEGWSSLLLHSDRNHQDRNHRHQHNNHNIIVIIMIFYLKLSLASEWQRHWDRAEPTISPLLTFGPLTYQQWIIQWIIQNHRHHFPHHHGNRIKCQWGGVTRPGGVRVQGGQQAGEARGRRLSPRWLLW